MSKTPHGSTMFSDQHRPIFLRDEGRIRIVTLNDGRMNLLLHPMRGALYDALAAADEDPGIKAVLLAAEGTAWCAGADLTEMDSGRADADPSPAQLVYDLLQTMQTPVVAVIAGTALGGGLELALGCHYRLAKADARIGLPEVTLGLLPGAGGTQLLPRAIGLEAAAHLILSGKIVKAGQFADTALFDAMLKDDPTSEALAFAVALPDGSPPRLGQRRLDHPIPGAFLETIRNNLRGYPKRTTGHLPAVDCLEAAATLPLHKGREIESQKFFEARVADGSSAFRYGFLAERQSSKVPDLAPDAVKPSIQNVAIIGAGVMGQGIAMASANAGLSVQLLDLSEAALRASKDAILDIYEKSVKRGRMSATQAETTAARITQVSDYEHIAACDLVIEAVVENMEIKKTVFETLDRVMKPGAILASNTSTLDLDQIAGFTSRPKDVVGLHFFNPAHIMRLLEVVRGKATAPQVLAEALAFGKRLRKVPVVSGVCDGFIGNRMMEQYLRQALFLVEEGASPSEVDHALETWGMAMGPFRVMDLAGNDVNDAIRARHRLEKPDYILPDIPDILTERGWLGQKSGTGWYVHEKGAKRPLQNVILTEELDNWRKANGSASRKISREEIVERCILSMVNEAAEILDEGIAQRASDVDVVYLTGYGFPAFRGGPLYFADKMGLRTARRKMRGFAGNPHGDPGFWTPHPLLERLSADGISLTQYGADQ